MILSLLADATSAIRYDQLGLDPVLLDLGWFKLRWYSIAYISGILIGWWYLVKLADQPGSPMAKRHADDFIFYATLGIIIGGRLGYCIFYKPEIFLTPISVFKLWEGGMSLHGGVLGTVVAIVYMARKNGLNWLRVHDYVACCWPFGQFFGRIANFINGELWGRPTSQPWGIIFPGTGDDVPRHPSQLYEAGLEGIILFAILWFLFWRTDARYQPGKLVGTAILGYGAFRFIIEYFREPDNGVSGLLGLTMGQTLSIPMVIGGIYLIATAKRRRQRVEAIAGSASVA